jgi:hypothetical protein
VKCLPRDDGVDKLRSVRASQEFCTKGDLGKGTSYHVVGVAVVETRKSGCEDELQIVRDNQSQPDKNKALARMFFRLVWPL